MLNSNWFIFSILRLTPISQQTFEHIECLNHRNWLIDTFFLFFLLNCEHDVFCFPFLLFLFEMYLFLFIVFNFLLFFSFDVKSLHFYNQKKTISNQHFRSVIVCVWWKFNLCSLHQLHNQTNFTNAANEMNLFLFKPWTIFLLNYNGIVFKKNQFDHF